MKQIARSGRARNRNMRIYCPCEAVGIFQIRLQIISVGAESAKKEIA
jgi:hypothetical protein